MTPEQYAEKADKSWIADPDSKLRICIANVVREAVAEERAKCAAIAHDVYLTAQARDLLTDIERGESRAASEIETRILATIEA